MNDLISWLRQQLDTDEQDARAAQDGDGYAEWNTPSTGVVQVAAGDLEGLVLARRNAAIHIANNDPARVLRQVQAHRAILDAYDRYLRSKERHDAEAERIRLDIERDERGEPVEGLLDVRIGALRREADYLAGGRPAPV